MQGECVCVDLNPCNQQKVNNGRKTQRLPDAKTDKVVTFVKCYESVSADFSVGFLIMTLKSAGPLIG